MSNRRRQDVDDMTMSINWLRTFNPIARVMIHATEEKDKELMKTMQEMLEDAQVASFNRNMNIAKMWVENMSVADWHGCATGDCPHELQTECDAVLKAANQLNLVDVWARSRGIWHLTKATYPNAADTMCGLIQAKCDMFVTELDEYEPRATVCEECDP